jgi:amidophosphoribosyltransferase
MVRSHHGTYAITTVGKINNTDAIIKDLFAKGHSHFLEMSGGDINATELVAAIVNVPTKIGLNTPGITLFRNFST